MDFDALRAAVVPGAGVVGRWPGVICVAECADRHVLRQLLDVCAGAAGGEPGRTLARRLAGWLGGPDAPGDGLRFGTVAVTGGDARGRGEQWAVFLYGPVGLVVPDRQVALSGAQSVAWTDRLLPRPDAPVVLALEGGPIPPGLVDGVHDLRVGVVPATGAVLVPSGEGPTGDSKDESGLNRPDERWPEADGQDRPRWGEEPLPSASPEGPYHGDSPGNGVPTGGSYGTHDGYAGYGSGGHEVGGHEGGAAERTTGPGSGRAHLRSVPSGSNGVAHRGWVPRRGPSLDTGREPGSDHGLPAADDSAGRTEDRPPVPPDHDEPRASEITAPGLGDDPHDNNRRDNNHLDNSPHDNNHPDNNQHDNNRHDNNHRGDGRQHDDNGHRNGRSGRNGRNGVRTNGASYGLLGGTADALQQETERSPWSDGRDTGRPERIEGWFATRDDAGTVSDLNAVGPAEMRRRRHRRHDDDAAGDDDHPAAETGGEAAADPGPADGDLGAAVGEHGGVAEQDSGDFGTGSGDDLRTGNEPGADFSQAGREPDRGSFDGGSFDGGNFDGGSFDGAGDGTPKLGVPRPPTDAVTEPDSVHPVGEPDAPRTTALRSEQILGVGPGGPERGALEDGPATGGLVVEEQQVSGFLCVRGHLNDPRAQYCALCGERIEEQAGSPSSGPRPPLGMLVFDDGATYTVDAEYLMGRMPEADPRVSAGALRSLALEDTSGAVSRVHAQIVMSGWDALLVDAGSRNGTFVSPPGEQGWTQLPAGESHRLVPGTRVRVGGRTFQFELPSGTR